MPEPDFYAVGDKEHLNATTVEEAVEEFLEDIFPDEAPDHVMVQGYVRLELKETHNSFSHCFDYMMECIDEEYNPEGETSPPPEIKEAFDKFVKVFVEKYPVWSCEEHGEPVRVDKKDYPNG